jgi:HlyD family secretion protein
MRRWLIRIGIVAAIVAVIVVLRLTVLRPAPVPVTVQRAARGTVEETVSNSKAGTVKARRRARISPEIGGRVTFIGARAGARVRAGQVLLRINDGDLRAALALAGQDLAAARSSSREACLSADLAERELRRSLDLKDEKIVSEDLLDRLESQRDVGQARCQAGRDAVERAQAAIDLARANLGKSVITAPFDGIVADLRTEVGEWASPSPAALPIPPVFDIIDPTSIYVSAPLDEVDAHRVSANLPARVSLDPFPGKSFPGRVTRVAPYVLDVEQQNRTLEVEVDFDDADFARTLLPGTSADVEVILKVAPDVLRIPAYALLEGDRVLIYEDGRIASRTVKPGMHNW